MDDKETADFSSGTMLTRQVTCSASPQYPYCPSKVFRIGREGFKKAGTCFGGQLFGVFSDESTKCEQR